MASQVAHDQLGPEIIGMRLNAFHLLPHLLDATITEAELARMYNITPEQVARARAYILCNPNSVLARHLEIEERIREGNPSEVREQALQTRELFLQFRDWVQRQREEEAREGSEASPQAPELPSFREWLAQQAH
jgi:hypothetical protein